MNTDRVTDSHVELNILDDTQECLNNNHHKIAFDYDEDTAIIKILKQIVCNYMYCLYNWYYLKSKVTQKLVLCKVKDFFDSGSNVSL
jgi:hypothetical protein